MERGFAFSTVGGCTMPITLEIRIRSDRSDLRLRKSDATMDGGWEVLTGGWEASEAVIEAVMNPDNGSRRHKILALFRCVERGEDLPAGYATGDPFIDQLLPQIVASGIACRGQL